MGPNDLRLARVVQTTAPGGSTAPAALASRLRVAMVRLARQLRHQDPPGPSISLYSALASIAGHEELAIGELAEAERLPSSAATRLADRLEEAGLAERRRNPADRRGVNLAITPEGQQVLDRHRQNGNAWLAGRLARLDGSQRATLAEALGVLEALLDDRTDEEPVEVTTSRTRRTGAR